tara:strand:+ start:133 stop:402 length:270 start_codon:yes stop_codon:yes gene_type:complete
MNNKVNKNGTVSLTKEDRDEVLKLVNILSETLSKVSEIYDLDLSDLRNMDELQWKLFHKLQFTHNETEKSYHEKYRLKETEAVELEMSR